MTAEARPYPRPWDGRRLLRFLAGLALVALAFAAPALSAAPATGGAPPLVTTVTTVDAPATDGGVSSSDAVPATVELIIVPGAGAADDGGSAGIGSSVAEPTLGDAAEPRSERAPPGA